MIEELEGTADADDDTAALQAKLDSMLVDTWNGSGVFPVLKLHGDFYINAPITCNTSGKKVVCIDGQNSTVLRWMGDTVSTPMLLLGYKATSQWAPTAPMLKGVVLVGNWKTRLLRIHNGNYRPIIRDVFCQTSREIAIDLVDCIGARVENVYLGNCRGMAIRTFRNQSTSYSNITIENSVGCQHSSGETADNNALWTYELANGRTAAMTEYDTDYVEYWPDPDDTTVQGFDDTYVKTAEPNRSFFHVSGNLYSIRDVRFLTNRSVSYPLVRAVASQGVIETFYSTGNACRTKVCFIQNETGSDATLYGRAATLRNFQDISAPVLSGTPRSAVELEGRTYSVLVDGMTLREHTHVVYADTGTHYGTTVERLGTWPSMLAADVIGEGGTASFLADTTYHEPFA
jgi:hypothetical protein